MLPAVFYCKTYRSELLHAWTDLGLSDTWLGLGQGLGSEQGGELGQGSRQQGGGQGGGVERGGRLGGEGKEWGDVEGGSCGSFEKGGRLDETGGRSDVVDRDVEGQGLGPPLPPVPSLPSVSPPLPPLPLVPERDEGEEKDDFSHYLATHHDHPTDHYNHSTAHKYHHQQQSRHSILPCHSNNNSTHGLSPPSHVVSLTHHNSPTTTTTTTATTATWSIWLTKIHVLSRFFLPGFMMLFGFLSLVIGVTTIALHTHPH